MLDTGHQCKAIGSRAFGEDMDTILRHSSAYMHGMKSVGMATTGKHFPGHGGVIADSHLEIRTMSAVISLSKIWLFQSANRFRHLRCDDACSCHFPQL